MLRKLYFIMYIVSDEKFHHNITVLEVSERDIKIAETLA
jgi:hypothetical protein